MSNKTRNKSLSNALTVLQAFSLAEPTLRVTTISQKTGLSKSTISRLLATLAAEGFVVKEPGYQGYQLSTKLLYLATLARRSQRLYQEALPFLHKLNLYTNQTACLVLLENCHALFLPTGDSLATDAPLIDFNNQQLLHQTSAGKLLLAHQAAAYRKRYETQNPDTANERETDLATRYPLDYVALQPMASVPYRAIATPLFNSQGALLAALTVIGPKEEFSKAELCRLIPTINKITEQTNAHFHAFES